MNQLEDHEFTAYDVQLTFLYGSKRSDLLSEIRGRDAYIVDNNVPWRKLASKHQNVSFVIGRTVRNETEDLQGTFFGKHAENSYMNIFVVGFESVNGILVYVIHRLDRAFRACFGSSLARLSQMTTETTEQFNSTWKREELRQNVTVHMTKEQIVLNAEIEALKPKCKGVFVNSCHAAERIYARFLLSLGKSEMTKEWAKFEVNHPHLFGDTCLIQEALFLGIGVLSNDDRDVGKMARIAGIKRGRFGT